MYDGREVAPLAATSDMYAGNASLARRGPLSIAVPGEVAAYHDAHQAHGNLPWGDLFAGAIKIAEDGFAISAHFENSIRRYQDQLRNTALMVCRNCATPNFTELSARNLTST